MQGNLDDINKEHLNDSTGWDRGLSDKPEGSTCCWIFENLNGRMVSRDTFIPVLPNEKPDQACFPSQVLLVKGCFRDHNPAVCLPFVVNPRFDTAL